MSVCVSPQKKIRKNTPSHRSPHLWGVRLRQGNERELLLFILYTSVLFEFQQQNLTIYKNSSLVSMQLDQEEFELI